MSTNAPCDLSTLDTAPVDELFNSMDARRDVLMGILAFCCEPRSVAQVNAEVARLQERDFSVYSGAVLCGMLEEVGALERLGQQRGREPQAVEVDGMKYWQPVPGEPVFWKTTLLGMRALELDDPLARLCDLLGSKPEYRPIYRTVLSLCALGNGIDAVSVGRAVDDEPVMQEPRMYAPAFLNSLENCKAVVWTGKLWTITDLGRTALAELEREA